MRRLELREIPVGKRLVLGKNKVKVSLTTCGCSECIFQKKAGARFCEFTAFCFAHGITKKAGAALLCALLILSALWSCASGPVTTKPRIVVSIQPQKYMLEQIAGRKWDVICLLPDGVATTGFDATITHLTNISGCKAYFMIGNISLEHAINGIVRNTYPSLKLYDNSEGLSLITPANGSQPDPYTWNSVKNAKVIAHNMYRSLSEMDPTTKGITAGG